ncbi:MAG: succinate dehydrogenase/fumarate reductase iron-sulfur subunit [Nitrospirota bacterium]|nr:succinate dehydrogenase/fumarate reductase iron-sulfur subunit [Nitrospirota bacterium]
MHTTLRVRRYNPEQDHPSPYYQEYDLAFDPSDSVLDGLIKVRETIDDSLTLRCSCRGAICGSCGMRINGHAALACKTKIISVAPLGETIDVEPMNNMPVIKDLVTDMAPFWEKIRQIQPWLRPAEPAPVAEYLAPPESMNHLAGVMSCIMCGVCVSDCTVLEVDTNFLGPAALAKAYRFVADHATSPHQTVWRPSMNQAACGIARAVWNVFRSAQKASGRWIELWHCDQRAWRATYHPPAVPGMQKYSRTSSSIKAF